MFVIKYINLKCECNFGDLALQYIMFGTPVYMQKKLFRAIYLRNLQVTIKDDRFCAFSKYATYNVVISNLKRSFLY